MLAASQIECVRGNRRLFRDLSFRLEAHQALRVRGENGSGKTSLLRIAAGLSPPESGRVSWNEGNIRTLGEDYLRDLLFLGHSNGLKDDLSPVENLRYALVLTGVISDEPALRAALAAAPSTKVLRVPAAALQQWLAPAPGESLESHVYVVDPMGQWMMRAPPKALPEKFKRDIDRLLRASSFWDRPGR